jgi:hypothetical protein
LMLLQDGSPEGLRGSPDHKGCTHGSETPRHEDPGFSKEKEHIVLPSLV